jgi:uncharacterized Zn finger protein
MFNIATSSLKMYGIIAISSIIGIFLLIFKLRGIKIDKLESQIQRYIEKAKAEQQQSIQRRNSKKVSNDLQKIADSGTHEKNIAESNIDKLVDTSISKHQQKVEKSESDKKIELSDSFIDVVRVGL